MARPSKGPWKRKGRGYWVQYAGRQVYLSDDKAEAKRKWHRLQSGEPLDDLSGRPSFAQVAEAYLDWLERARSERHYTSTRWRLDQLAATWKGRAAESLRTTDVDAALRKYPSWGPTTQAQVLGALRACLTWAARTGGMIASNPLPKMTIPRRQRRVHVLSPEQMSALLIASPRPLRMILWALSECGARPNELCRATKDHCDVDGAAIRLPTGKQGRRLIFFPPAARPIIARLRKEADPYLFVNAHGDPWRSLQSLPLAVKRARRKAELPEWVSAYVLRHTWATERLRAGTPIATVARMMGTSVAMIDSVYGHMSDQDLRAVADGMA